eukprot:gnl/TRDRNA2_/TRDRNA2_134081_c0_seq1.p1 gnl/TRDRNA2_/TRDRNA2_134081_c0~~gnl/TRDRNA2_/TRDRNA2_134081_c0_seq1.p1  ORF type:complete len:732 (-),score=103.53 gnl/TRDRNA2_/TRDRNA2_134081_c0_seq1:61-2256(-)
MAWPNTGWSLGVGTPRHFAGTTTVPTHVSPPHSPDHGHRGAVRGSSADFPGLRFSERWALIGSTVDFESLSPASGKQKSSPCLSTQEAAKNAAPASPQGWSDLSPESARLSESSCLESPNGPYIIPPRMGMSVRLREEAFRPTDQSIIGEIQRRHEALFHEAGSPLRYQRKKGIRNASLPGAKPDARKSPASRGKTVGQSSSMSNLLRIADGLEAMRHARNTAAAGGTGSPYKGSWPVHMDGECAGPTGVAPLSPANFIAPSSPGHGTAQSRIDCLKNFSKFVEDHFDGELQKAWEAFRRHKRLAGRLLPVQDVYVTEYQFLSELHERGYGSGRSHAPYVTEEKRVVGDAEARELFHCIDTDKDGLVTWDDLTSALPKLAHDRGNPKIAKPYEVQPGKRGANLAQARERLLARLAEQDPPASQFLEFLFAQFHTLRQAFQQMDINGNGILSRMEFFEGIKALKPPKDGLHYLAFHAQDLFRRFDHNGDGEVTIDEMTLMTVHVGDPMLDRLNNFFLDFAESFVKLPADKEAAKDMAMRFAFKKMDLDGSDTISKDEFARVLDHFRYPEWHMRDLFKRLDKDDSGNLTLVEFTAFLERQASQKKQAPNQPAPPVDDKSKAVAETGHVASLASSNLSRSRSLPDKLKPRTAVFSNPDGTVEERPLPVFERPDYLELMRNRPNQRPYGFSEFARTGKLVCTGGLRAPVDVAPLRAGVHHFDADEPRSHVLYSVC